MTLCNAVYMMSNKKDGTIYTGPTNDLRSRIAQHKLGLVKFTKKYNLYNCVYFELCDDTGTALQMEARYKSYNRQWKIEMIEISIQTGKIYRQGLTNYYHSDRDPRIKSEGL